VDLVDQVGTGDRPCPYKELEASLQAEEALRLKSEFLLNTSTNSALSEWDVGSLLILEGMTPGAAGIILFRRLLSVSPCSALTCHDI